MLPGGWGHSVTGLLLARAAMKEYLFPDPNAPRQESGAIPIAAFPGWGKALGRFATAAWTYLRNRLGSSGTRTACPPSTSSTTQAPQQLLPAPTPLTRGQRLTEYFNRLRGQPASRTADEALGRVSQTLHEVEDALSGIPRQNPPPPPNMPDGRMYPPLADRITRHADGSITAQTRGHDISIGRDGSITMTNRQTGQVDFHQPGAGN